MSQGRLNDTPWPGTVALYVAEVPVVAPPTVGRLLWMCRFANADLALTHSDACAGFSFLTAPQPDHQVTVNVTDRQTHEPIADVDVRCGSYRAVTDTRGVATLRLPAGTYELAAWKVGYDDAPSGTVEVASDLVIHLEMAPTPKREIDDERVWM